MRRKLQVFLCHASEDKLVVRELYERLKSENWIDPWLDSEKILAGQNWDLEIEKAIQNSDVIIVCLSKTSINKEGYVQKEIKRALDISEEKPEWVIHLIPLKLDDCDIPRALAKRQSANYYDDEAYNDLLKSLSERMTQIQNALYKKSDFKFVCDFCKKTINVNDEGGIIYVPKNAVLEAERITKEIEEMGKTGPIPANKIDIISSTAYWRTSHYTCGQDEYPEYQIDISRMKTAKQVIEWTSHLMEKNWIALTNWWYFISMLAEQLED
jgi:uncharacterized protein YfeS